MRYQVLVAGVIVFLAASSASCSSSDAGALDGGSCGGADCLFADQSCPEGEVVTGVNADGTLVCVRQATGLRQQQCSAQQVVGGVRADGSIICVDPFASSLACDEGEFVTGIDPTGNPMCASITGSVLRDYINTNCYVYIGWRDSCDGCADVPVKVGRTRGADMGCQVSGSDGSCALFDLFGQMIELAGISTDGDVNDDDKFWVGLKCE